MPGGRPGGTDALIFFSLPHSSPPPSRRRWPQAPVKAPRRRRSSAGEQSSMLLTPFAPCGDTSPASRWQRDEILLTHPIFPPWSGRSEAWPEAIPATGCGRRRSRCWTGRNGCSVRRSGRCRAAPRAQLGAAGRHAGDRARASGPGRAARRRSRAHSGSDQQWCAAHRRGASPAASS